MIYISTKSCEVDELNLISQLALPNLIMIFSYEA
jgi:hypothetical protein